MMKITIDELITHIKMGREIEFNFNSIPYFIEPDYKTQDSKELQVILSDCSADDVGTVIFNGTIQEFLAFKFEGKYDLNNYSEMMNIEWVL